MGLLEWLILGGLGSVLARDAGSLSLVEICRRGLGGRSRGHQWRGGGWPRVDGHGGAGTLQARGEDGHVPLRVVVGGEAGQ